MKLSTSLSVLLFAIPALAQELVEEDWSSHPTRLPTPTSDLTATLDPTSGLIYLIGGCNAETGNSLVFNTTFYGCSSVTAAAYAFDTASGKIDTAVPDAPRPRYRHAAAYVQGHIWLVGGRDLEDNLVTAIDVYSVGEGRWLDTESTLELPSNLVTSDLTAFATEDEIHVIGGYDVEYTAVTTTYAIDVAASLSGSQSLVWSERGGLAEARGDTNAVWIEESKTAYVVGGFTHADFWCKALSSVEQYDVDTDTWVRADPLTYERGDKAVAVVGSRLFVIGGESNTDCDLDPAQRTAPTTEVEVLDTSDGEEATWQEEIADIPDDHFRFPAVAYDGTIYTFGGQAYYESSCDCFPTRDTIFFYNVQEVKKWGVVPIAACSVAAVALVVGVILFAKSKSGNKERPTEIAVAEQDVKTGVQLN